jgi:hypothetical protein
MHLWTCAITHPTLHTSTQESNHEVGPMSFTKNIEQIPLDSMSVNKQMVETFGLVSKGNQNTKISTF